MIGKNAYSSATNANNGTYKVLNDGKFIELIGDNSSNSSIIDGVNYLKTNILNAKKEDKSIFKCFDTSNIS